MEPKLDDTSSPRPRLAAVADRVFAAVLVLSPAGVIEYVNRAGAVMLRQDPGWLVGRDFLELVHPTERPRAARDIGSVGRGRPTSRSSRFRMRAQPAFGWQLMEASSDNLLDDPDVAGILVSLRDVTEQSEQERALTEAAFRDQLTGLPNRAAIVPELEALTQRGGELSVALAAVDRLSVINDSLGHAAGDELIRAVAKRARSAVPRSTIVGRLEGDVLVLLLVGVSPAESQSLLWRVVERIREPMFVGGREVSPSVSVGLAPASDPAGAEATLSDAGLALRRAKAQGGGRVEMFRPAMREEAVARLEMEADLRHALHADELRLAFQPIVRLADGVEVASEALLRWTHEGVTYPPPTFIRVAEETGLIVPLGEWVLDQAARAVPHLPGGRVSVNLSPRQLVAPGLVDTVRSMLHRRGVDPAKVSFEVTETVLIEHFDYAVGVLANLRRMGSCVGLDDFGTGYSSLGYLRRLPIDFLKLDRSLVADLDADVQARAIGTAVVEMSKALHLDVIAEGVEREGQLAVLRKIGATHAQGFLLGAPAELTVNWA